MRELAQAYESTDGDPVRMCLSTGCTLYFECPEVWGFGCVLGMQVGHPVGTVSLC